MQQMTRPDVFGCRSGLKAARLTNSESVAVIGPLVNNFSPATIDASESADAVRSPARRGLARIWKGVVCLWKYLLGVVFCQNLFTSVLVVGWTYRLVQRSVLKQWWKQSRIRSEGVSLEHFLTRSPQIHDPVYWPNWILRQVPGAAVQRANGLTFGPRFRAFLKALFHSLWLNLKTGAQGIFNTWVLTLPGCTLWLFAWYDGWNNSFNKGYEQAAVGPLTGIFGVMLFIAAMFYLPLAQARQAATGQWRSFYQFRLVWSLVRRKWLACLGLAILYSTLSVPVTILKTVPVFFPQMKIEALANATDPQALQILKIYFFWASFVVFPAYVVLRLAAARIYAASVLSAVQRGVITEEALAEIEWEALHWLDLLEVQPRKTRHVLVRLVAWVGTRAGRMTVAVAIFLVWFTFVAQIFTSEFLNYHPVIGWLNQPLVQLPWFHYIPLA